MLPISEPAEKAEVTLPKSCSEESEALGHVQVEHGSPDRIEAPQR